ncbi:TetR family transcriptional regulator [Streptomyces sp. SID5785]|uniref:TetR/AcrR family transcriptional regulator n=1 Tax=Streptomyces sp. SID5785 TaxID=2690309 RepID=UPI001361E26C|nr:TetR/AcrR family transcriptional regulator [Streptomyces sp. SID5785]MZD04737.1 TetR family transcriptional regulator [Streptomyces sp. SID5785]
MPIKPGTVTAKGRETRRRIVAAAAQLMFERGVADTTIEEVRTRAAVSNSQIYHHFADKTALVRAVIEHQSNAVIEPQEQLFARLDTMDGLRQWRDFAVARQRELNCRGGCPIASLTHQLAENDEPARLQLAHSFARWSAGLRAGLAAMHASGRLRPDADPEALALALLAALQGGLLLTQLGRDTKPLETALDTMLAHIEAQTV